jgi:hypothetical protein
MTDSPRCLTCGYDIRLLRGSHCPECGRFFDRADPSTYAVGGRTPDWRRWAKPPPRWSLAVLGACTVILLDGASKPFGLEANPIGCFAVVWGVGASVSYVARIVTSWKDRERSTHDKVRRHSRTHWRWYVTPACVVLVLLLLDSGWALRVRFRLSQPAFEATVADVLTGKQMANAPAWIGLYRVRSIESNGVDCVRFQTGHALGPTGFEYRAAALRNSTDCVAPHWCIQEWE